MREPGRPESERKLAWAAENRQWARARACGAAGAGQRCSSAALPARDAERSAGLARPWPDAHTGPPGRGVIFCARDTVKITQVRNFRGRFTLPGDKSISHRLAILGALAAGETEIANFSSAADCASTLRCLEGLGVGVERSGHTVVIRGEGPERLRAPNRRLDAGNSGSTLRMLAGAVAARPFTTTLTGDASLRRRPVERVAAPLRAMGAEVETSEGRPPLTLHGGPLRGVRVRLASRVASACAPPCRRRAGTRRTPRP